MFEKKSSEILKISYVYNIPNQHVKHQKIKIKKTLRKNLEKKVFLKSYKIILYKCN